MNISRILLFSKALAQGMTSALFLWIASNKYRTVQVRKVTQAWLPPIGRALKHMGNMTAVIFNDKERP